MPGSHQDHPLQTHSLGLVLQRRRVLDGVTVRFDPGSVTTIVGPSGAGKTSLLRCLNRLVEPNEGYVSIDGEDIRAFRPTILRRKVGMIFQTPVIFPGGVRSNLTYGLEASEESMRAALARSGLPPEFVDRDSKALSVGQAQRVCIARALIRDPEALLMDEPTSALDKDAVARIEDLIVTLARSGLILVVVTHNLEQARRIGDSAVLLREGKVAATGPPADVADAWPEEKA